MGRITADADDALNAIGDALCGKGDLPANCWEEEGERYMHEEHIPSHSDGAITGVIYRFVKDETKGDVVERVMSYRIEPDGQLSRGPLSWQEVNMRERP